MRRQCIDPMLRGMLTAAACSWLCLASPAFAADGDDRYAVVALVGDELSLVAYQPSVGTARDNNKLTRIPNRDDRYDRLATEVTVASIHRAMPAAALQPVRIDDRSAFADPESVLSANGSLPALLDAVRAGLADKDTHYLVLVSKYHGDAHLMTDSGSIGSGKLTGLGFYVDTRTRMRRNDTHETGRGFLAPFAYVMVSLIDLRTGSVIRSEAAMESEAIANAGPDSTGSPWDVISPERKVALLDAMLRTALLRAVPHVVAPA